MGIGAQPIYGFPLLLFDQNWQNISSTVAETPDNGEAAERKSCHKRGLWRMRPREDRDEIAVGFHGSRSKRLNDLIDVNPNKTESPV